MGCFLTVSSDTTTDVWMRVFDQTRRLQTSSPSAGLVFLFFSLRKADDFKLVGNQS